MNEQTVERFRQQLRRWGRARRFAARGLLLLGCAALSGCQRNSGPSAAELAPVAKFFADHEGFALDGGPKRPCLRGVDPDNTVLGGLFGGGASAVVKFVEKNNLATVTLTPDGMGRSRAALRPTTPHKANWISKDGTSYYCFGTFTVTRIEPVADAKPITAGSDEPHLIPGTEAYAVRLTYKWDGVSPELVDALKETPNVLIPGSMSPADYGTERTVVAVLPDKVENFQLNR